MTKKKKTAKKAEPIPIGLAALEKLTKEANKKYGPDSLVRADKAPLSSKYLRRLRTGCFALDVATGGGIPKGHVSMFWGPESSGKTHMAYSVIAAAQRQCRYCGSLLIPWGLIHGAASWRSFLEFFPGRSYECLGCGRTGDIQCRAMLVDAEKVYNRKWAAGIGIDEKLLYYLRPKHMEQVIDTVDAVLNSNECDLVIIDSIAALIPIREIESSAEEDMVGVHARKMNSAWRKWIQATVDIEGARPTLLAINQIRQKVGVMYGNPETLPTGEGQKFAASVRVKFRSGKYHIEKGEKAPNRAVLNFIVDKSRICVPRIEGTYQVALRDHKHYHSGQFIEEREVLTCAKQYGWVYDRGKIWRHPEPDGGMAEYRTLETLENRWRDDPAFFRNWVREEVLKVTLGGLA